MALTRAVRTAHRDRRRAGGRRGGVDHAADHLAAGHPGEQLAEAGRGPVDALGVDAPLEARRRLACAGPGASTCGRWRRAGTRPISRSTVVVASEISDEAPPMIPPTPTGVSSASQMRQSSGPTRALDLVEGDERLALAGPGGRAGPGPAAGRGRRRGWAGPARASRSWTTSTTLLMGRMPARVSRLASHAGDGPTRDPPDHGAGEAGRRGRGPRPRRWPATGRRRRAAGGSGMAKGRR